MHQNSPFWEPKGKKSAEGAQPSPHIPSPVGWETPPPHTLRHLHPHAYGAWPRSLVHNACSVYPAKQLNLQHFTTAYTHTHTHLTALCQGLPGWDGTRNVKPIWILLKQETVSGSGISWAVCKSAPHSRQITTPAPHHSVFTGWMPFLPPNQQRQSAEGSFLLQHNTEKSLCTIISL